MTKKREALRTLLLTTTLLFLLTACSVKEAIKSQSATILIKTPAMKFYDRGFISTFPSHTQVQIYQAGNIVLDMKIYEDRVCETTFRCKDLKTFNREFLRSSYKDGFLKELFESSKKDVTFRDKKNGILIKIKKD